MEKSPQLMVGIKEEEDKITTILEEATSPAQEIDTGLGIDNFIIQVDKDKVQFKEAIIEILILRYTTNNLKTRLVEKM